MAQEIRPRPATPRGESGGLSFYGSARAAAAREEIHDDSASRLEYGRSVSEINKWRDGRKRPILLKTKKIPVIHRPRIVAGARPRERGRGSKDS